MITALDYGLNLVGIEKDGRQFRGSLTRNQFDSEFVVPKLAEPLNAEIEGAEEKKGTVEVESVEYL